MSSTVAIAGGTGLAALIGAIIIVLLRRGASSYRLYGAVILAVAVPFGAAGYYLQSRPAPAPIAGPHSGEDLSAGATALAAELATRPGDVDGWVLLARTYAQLERYGEARDALAKALALKPEDTTLHAQLGEILVLAADGLVTPAAAAEFARAPADPRARYYGALGLAQQGDTAKARGQMQALLDDSAADAPWRQGVVDALAEFGAAPVETPSGNGLDAEIDRLTRQVDQAPDDAQAWLALARDQRLAGRDEAARAVLQRATTRIHGDRALLLAYADVLTAGLTSETLPPELVTVMSQINLLDPDQADALWYLGLAAAQHGDRHRATSYWTRLLAALPADSAERQSVQHRLEALP